jgi:hypothetical protein
MNLKKGLLENNRKNKKGNPMKETGYVKIIQGIAEVAWSLDGVARTLNKEFTASEASLLNL